MLEIDAMLRRPLTPDAVKLLGHLLDRRREGDTALPTVQQANDELGFLIPATRACAAELDERRLIVQDGQGLLAKLRWPLVASIHGKQIRMSLAQQLEDAGVAVTEEQSDAWADLEGDAEDVEPPPEAGNAADAVFPMIAAARSGDLPQAMSLARKVTAATIGTAAVPLLARAAGWFARVLTAMGAERSPALRYEPPESEVAAAREAYEQGFSAELARHRDLAMQEYVRALHADPGFHRARLRYVWMIYTADRAGAAVDELSGLVEANPQLSAARLVRAAILVDLATRGEGDPEGVAEKVAPDLDAVDQDAQADRALSRLLRSRAALLGGQVPVAIKTARHAIALEPSRPDAYDALGQALTQAEEWVAAAWAHGAALMADHEHLAAGEALFNLRQIAEVEAAVPHARGLIDHTWQ